MHFSQTRTYRPKRWNVAEANPAAAELAERLKTSALIAQILLNRGMSRAEDCQTFLRPSMKCLHDPALIPNLTQAAERIAQAIRDNKKIVIYGDYDVDGITATAILWHAIRILGGQSEYYIPHRLEEGYGLNVDAIREICQNGAGLIITVDCGITALEPAKIAREHGVEMIVTDHHEWKESAGNPCFPDCFTIVHPRLPGNSPAYPNPHLCGAGVAFKLAWGIGQAMNGAAKASLEFRQFLCEATALAALGTIADVVPLVGENRVLAYYGLGGLKSSKLTGIKAIIESSNLTGQKLDSYHVGFLLAPKLNACGRMGHAGLAVEMLTKADQSKANEIAIYLEQQNRERQAIERKILDEALQQIEDHRFDSTEYHAIVLGAEGWHPGVIGIVASRIVDRFHRPTIMVAFTEGIGQGSGRSIKGFHLAKALTACQEHLQGFGGHEMAAGLKVQFEKFEAFRQCFQNYAKKELPAEMMQPQISLESVAELHHMTPALVIDLQRLGPFGHGNPKPLLCCRDLEIVSVPNRVGRNGDHLQLRVRQGKHTIKCIAFGCGELFDRLQPGTHIDLAAEPTINEYNGRSSVELTVKDIQIRH